MLRLDSPELKAAALLYQRAPREIQAGIKRQAVAWAPTLKAAAERRATDPVSRRIAASGKVTVTNKGVAAVFGSAGKLSSGEPLRNVTRAYEFGSAYQSVKREYIGRQRVTKRRVFIKRRTRAQLPRDAKNTGRFVYPAVADCAPDLVSRWVGAVVKTYREGV